MKYVIWGTGPYCQSKIIGINDEDIVAIVDRDIKKYKKWTTILPIGIKNIEYDQILVMSNHYIEIIKEMIEMGIDYKKIVPGIACKPYLAKEMEIMSNNVNISVTEEGYIKVDYLKQSYYIKSNKDFEQVKNNVLSKKNERLIKEMEVEPAGRLFGLDRGGSICRYYLKKFLDENRDNIKGRTLEIGDRTYSEIYFKNITESYCLHYDEEKRDNIYDFFGDLTDGRGLKSNYYDCIILTQVLNFVKKIDRTPQILVDSLRVGGSILLTVSGITPISRYDMDRWGHFWNFTVKGIQSMFSMENVDCEVRAFGNYKVACAFLGGMSSVELSDEELNIYDDDFQVIIVARIRKLSE